MGNEEPFTLRGHSFASPIPITGKLSIPLTLPPRHTYSGSPANYWLLDEKIISNMVIALHPTDPSVPIFKMPHAVIEGVVEKALNEGDGDHHLWVTMDGGKALLACEITPQNPLPVPKVGEHVRIYGIFRYDFQHGWWEIHPVDFIEPITA